MTTQEQQQFDELRKRVETLEAKQGTGILGCVAYLLLLFVASILVGATLTSWQLVDWYHATQMTDDQRSELREYGFGRHLRRLVE